MELIRSLANYLHSHQHRSIRLNLTQKHPTTSNETILRILIFLAAGLIFTTSFASTVLSQTTDTTIEISNKTEPHNFTSAILISKDLNKSTAIESQNQKAASNSTISTNAHSVLLGSVIHLFPRYGYLSLSMRIVSRNDTDNRWLILEPSKFIFEPTTVAIQQQTFIKPTDGLPLQNMFHIDLCEDTDQLLRAYFSRFKVDGSSPGKSWKAFSGGWQTPSIIRYFGMDTTFLNKNNRDYLSFVLVRLLLVHNHGQLVPLSNTTMTNDFQDEFNIFQSQDYNSSYNFFNSVGTHYISSYLTGNSIYQVFLFDTTRSDGGFDVIKRHLQSEVDMDAMQKEAHLAQLPKLITTWATHTGQVMVLNANPEATKSIQNSLRLRTSLIQPYNYTSNIFKMYNNKRLVQKIEKYLKNQNDGIIGLELKMIDLLFSNETQREWYLESLKQTISLWEVNL